MSSPILFLSVLPQQDMKDGEMAEGQKPKADTILVIVISAAGTRELS